MHQNFLAILYKAMWRYSKGRRWYLPVFIGLMGIATLLIQFLPYIFGQIINQLQFIVTNKSDSFSIVKRDLILYSTVALAFWVLHGPGRLMELRFAFFVRKNCLNDLYDKTQRLSLEWHQDHHSGSMTDRIKGASGALHAFLTNQFRIIQAVINTIVPLIFLSIIAWPLAVICLSGGVLALTAMICADKKLVPVLNIKRDLGHNLTALLVDYISNIQSIITLRLGLQTKKELDQRLQAEEPADKAGALWNEIKWGSTDLIISLTRILVVVYLIYAFQKGTIREIGVIIASVQYIQIFAGVFVNLSMLYEQTVRQAIDFESVAIITEAYDAQHIHEISEMTTRSAHAISIRDMNFTYKNSQSRLNINGVCLDMQAGHKIAFVGASGSGKSTAMKLLRGLYQVDQGTILFDDKAGPWSDLGNMTTLIPQEPENFENTVRYNITMGVTHDEPDIMAACDIACFDDVLKELPQGLDTDMREKGVNLSGGQKQRLALARGVFAAEDSAIILLDEPTSSIDGLTEREIYKNLFAKFAGKIIIGSIHRLHLLNEFDKIYVFDQGRIAQSGTLDELLVEKGMFKNLWDAYQNAQEQG